MDTPKWVTDLFQTIDRMDAEGFVSFLAADAQFRYGNMPPIRGREAIRTAVADFFQTIGGLRHRVIRTWTHPDSVICELEVTYTRKDNARQVTVPAATIFYMVGEKIGTYLIYNDLAPVYAPES